MIKQITLEEIKKALRDYPSAEPDGDEIIEGESRTIKFY